MIEKCKNCAREPYYTLLPLRLMVDENARDVDGDSLETLLKIFLTLIKRFTLLVRSL